MKKRLGLFVAAAALSIAAVSPVSAAPSVKVIGTPGTPNCVGQTTAWVNDTAQFYAQFFDIASGQAGFAELFGYDSVAALKQAIRTYCGV